MKLLDEWTYVESPNKLCFKDLDPVHLRIFHQDDPERLYAEVHTAGCCFERIKRSPTTGKWISCYFYMDESARENEGFLGGDSEPVRVIDEDIKTVEEMAEYLIEYASECKKRIEEMCNDYNEKRPQWIKDSISG